MIKKYSQFVRVNEFNEYEQPLEANTEMPVPMNNAPIMNQAPVEMEEEEEEEEGEYNGKVMMDELAGMLGVEVSADGSINYEGKKINFYSETEKFHVDRKKFDTPDDVADYLNSESDSNAVSVNAPRPMNNQMMRRESNSYRYTRRK